MDLFGRSEECRALDALLVAARARRSEVLVVRGPAGIGKTQLLDHIVEAADDFLVVQLTGIEAERALGYAALRRLLTPILHQIERLPDPQRDALTSALGMTSGSGSDLFLVGLGIISLANNAARARSLLLCVIDDAQWIDRESLEALAFWGRRMDAEGIALIFGVREGTDAVGTLDGFPTLVVEGLGPEGSRALLADRSDVALDRHLVERIITDTGGNPLALLELTSRLTARELTDAASRPEPLPLEQRLEDHFMEKVRALEPATQKVLLLAAADSSGEPALLWRAAALLGASPAAVEPAEAAGLLALGEKVVFRHPLVRSAVYSGASAPQRREAHRALASATAVEDAERRAWHLAAAAIGADDRVAQLLEDSADAAATSGSHTARTALLRRSAELTSDPQRAAQRRIDAAESALVSGSATVANELLERAAPFLETPESQARAQRLVGGALLLAGRTADAAPILLTAAKTLIPVDPAAGRETLLEALEAALLAGARSAGNSEVVTEAAGLALATATDRCDPVTDRLLDGVSTWLACGSEAAAPRLHLVVEAIHDERVPSERFARWTVLLSHVCRVLWDDAAWDRLHTRVAESCRRRGDLIRLASALQALATTATWAGRPAAADRYLSEAADVARATGLGGDRGQLDAELAGLDVLALRGSSATRQKAAAIVELAERAGVGTAASLAHLATMQLDVAEGRYGDAVDHARAVIGSELFACRNQVLPDLIEAAVRDGRTTEAAEAMTLLSEHALAAGSRWALGLMARSRALVAGADGEADYLEAISLLGSTRMAIDTARAHLLYGEWLRRHHRRVDARAELRRAHEMFAEMQVAAFAERARIELLATGEHVRKRTLETMNDLTPQEAIIARMARGGETNAEIAAKMYLSASTVDYHLRKVYRKLGITSRRQLRSTLPDDSDRFEGSVIRRA